MDTMFSELAKEKEVWFFSENGLNRAPGDCIERIEIVAIDRDEIVTGSVDVPGLPVDKVMGVETVEFSTRIVSVSQC